MREFTEKVLFLLTPTSTNPAPVDQPHSGPGLGDRIEPTWRVGEVSVSHTFLTVSLPAANCIATRQNMTDALCVKAFSLFLALLNSVKTLQGCCFCEGDILKALPLVEILAFSCSRFCFWLFGFQKTVRNWHNGTTR